MTQEKAEIKHTPGPWSIDTGLGVFPEDGIPITDDATGEEICVAWPQSLDDAQVANARLIAAAPDLLAALQAFYKWWGSIDCICLNPEPIPNALGEQMEAAIAKATNTKP